MSNVARSWSREAVNVAGSPVVRKGGLALADQLVASATNFATGVIIGRACTQDQLGLYMLGFSVVLLAMRLQVSLISTPYMVYSPRLADAPLARYTGSTLIHQLVLSAIAVVGAASAGLVFSMGIGPPGLAPVMRALAVAVALILFREYARNVCFATLNFKTAFIMDLSVAIVQVGGLIVLAYLGRLSSSVAFLTTGAACALAVVIWLVGMRGSVSIEPSHVRPDFTRNWVFGRWIFGSAFLWELCLSLYPWVLAHFHGTAATGVWAACYGAVAIGNPALLGVQNFLGPRIAHSYAGKDVSGFNRFISRSAAMYTILIVPFSIGLVLFGGRLVAIVYGQKYVGHGLVVALLAVDLLFGPARFAFSRALFAMERAVAEFYTNFIPVVFLVVLGVWVVRLWGPTGVASSMLAAGILVTAAKYFAFVVSIASERRHANP